MQAIAPPHTPKLGGLIRQHQREKVKLGNQVIAEGIGVCRELGISLRVTTLQVNGELLAKQAEPAGKHQSKVIEQHEQAAHHHLNPRKGTETGVPPHHQRLPD